MKHNKPRSWDLKQSHLPAASETSDQKIESGNKQKIQSGKFSLHCLRCKIEADPQWSQRKADNDKHGFQRKHESVATVTLVRSRQGHTFSFVLINLKMWERETLMPEFQSSSETEQMQKLLGEATRNNYTSSETNYCPDLSDVSCFVSNALPIL